MKLFVPEELNRNSPEVHAAGPENTGSEIICHVAKRLGIRDFEDLHILDIGCGVRFAQAIINRLIPIGSYTGVDVYKPLIDYLQAEISDPRFRFAWWNAHNEQYNPGGEPMSSYEDLPIGGQFDVIWLFSVFTHLIPDDSLKLLKLLTSHAHEHTRLVFTAFISDGGGEEFENRSQLPAIDGYYSESYMRRIILSAGWHAMSLDQPYPERYVQHMFVCCPNLSVLATTEN